MYKIERKETAQLKIAFLCKEIAQSKWYQFGLRYKKWKEAKMLAKKWQIEL